MQWSQEQVQSSASHVQVKCSAVPVSAFKCKCNEVQVLSSASWVQSGASGVQRQSCASAGSHEVQCIKCECIQVQVECSQVHVKCKCCQVQVECRQVQVQSSASHVQMQSSVSAVHASADKYNAVQLSAVQSSASAVQSSASYMQSSASHASAFKYKYSEVQVQCS